MKEKMSRRKMLLGSGATLLSVVACSRSQTAEKIVVATLAPKPYRLALNAATISAYNLPIEQQIDLVAKAGYEGIELWTKDIDAYIEKGGKLPNLRKRLEENNLIFENTIGFAQWLSNDKGMEDMKREMEVTAELGGRNIAATSFGMKTISRSMLDVYAERYARVLEFAKQTGVRPLLEVWGAGAINQLADAIHIAAGSKSSNAAFLLDFYHLYRGGNSYNSLKLIHGSALPIFHLNDFPANPPREQLNDSDRVYPGDGICPFDEVLPILKENGFNGAFSLELFNQSYWENPNPMVVLKTGYEKSKNILERYF